MNFYDANNIEKIGQIEKIRNMMANIQHEDEKWWEECVALIVDEKQLNKDQMQKIKTTDRSKSLINAISMSSILTSTDKE